jgi:hypothetical protein
MKQGDLLNRIKLICSVQSRLRGTTLRDYAFARTIGSQITEAYSGAALSPRALVSFETSEATTITTAIKPITSVQMALISGFTPSRTS